MDNMSYYNQNTPSNYNQNMGNNFNSYNYKYSPQINSNVLRVTTLEEAVMRTTMPGSDMVYFNQDKDEFYRVKVDFEGKKCWATFMFTAPKPLQAVPVDSSEIESLKERLRIIEDKLLIKKEDNSNAQLNGQTIQ